MNESRSDGITFFLATFQQRCVYKYFFADIDEAIRGLQ